MATLVLRSAGAALGTALGGPLGGLVGGALGAVGGAVVDNLLANALTSRRNRAPQLDEIAITHAEEGAPVRKLWGRMRLGGNVIWCTQFQAVTTKQKTTSASGKGLGASDQGDQLRALLRGGVLRGGRRRQPRPRLGRRQRARPQPVRLPLLHGSESQVPDDWIESRRGHRRRAGLSRHLLPRVQPHAARATSATACRRSPPRSSAARRSPIPTTSPTRSRPSACCRAPASSCSARRSTSRRTASGPGSRRTSTRRTASRTSIRRSTSSTTRCRTARPCRWWWPGSARTSGPGPAASCPRSRRDQDGAAGRLGRGGLHPRHRRRGQPGRPRDPRPDGAQPARRRPPARCRPSAARRPTTRWCRPSRP